MNTSIYPRKVTASALGLTLLLQGSLSWADDTEIFSGQIPADIKPNVLFILDDSNSMNWCLDNQIRRPCSSGPKRIDILKKTMNNLLNDIKDVNIGIMTLNAPQTLLVDDIDKIRDNAKSKVDRIHAYSNTPIAKTLYDAASYFNDFPPHHKPNARINAPSPITHECQPSHIVLLSDGQANENNAIIQKNIQNLIGGGLICPNRGSDKNKVGGETCTVELAAWMHTTDQSPKENIPTIQTINTHTIGFALEADPENKASIQKFLKDLATAGGGRSYTADNATELSDVFEEIIKQAKQVQNTSFVNPSAAGGDYQADENKKQIYYSMYKPVPYDSWPGNLKRYGLKVTGTDNLVEIDSSNPPKEAKEANGQFKSDAKSWWSDMPDGNNVSQGGAAWKLPAPNERNLWVSIGDTMERFPITTTNGSNITLDNPANSGITQSLLNASSDNERKVLLRHIRGFDDDGITARRALVDPLHSAPTLFSYECQGTFNQNTGKCLETSEQENTSQMAVMGSNEGFVHMFDTHTGIEQFAFMPDELLKNIKPLHENRLTDDRPRAYGMDNTVTVWVNDKDKNGKIDGNDTVYAYATMRRGGSSIYALNITDRNNPKFMWKISAGETGFERLGQTWSVPVKTKIDLNGKVTDVLIFGGGYDEKQDEPSNYQATNQQGNDIYIVDAETGSMLWSASSTLNLDKMQYSIPGAVRVLSLDASGNPQSDGLATQMFVGDVGGQIWRFFINHGKSGNDLVTAAGQGNNGLLANLSGSAGNHNADARRFYHGPDVALGRSAGDSKLFVNIGSGYRAHPLDTTVKDRMYSLHIPLTDNGKTLHEKDLSQVADGKFDGSKVTSDIKSGSSGWYIELQKNGEKIISTPKTIEGHLFFNSYVPPTASTNPCEMGIGDNLTLEVSVLNATPVSAASGATGSYSDYAVLSKNQGISGDPNVFCFDEHCWVQFGRGEFSDPFSRSGLGQRTYWIDLAE